MKLEELLKEKREDLLESWRQLLVHSYPPETAKFLEREKDQFANPVGHFIKNGTSRVLDQLLGDMDLDVIRETLDPVIRIRAVQDFSPSDALAFVFDLKLVIRKMVDEEPGNANLLREFLDFESRIDRLGLTAFETYTSCRDKLQAIRADSLQRRYAVMLKRLNKLGVDPDAQDILREGEA